MLLGPAVVDAFREQSEADLDSFLRLRAREFAPGGLLLVVGPGTRPAADIFNSLRDAAAELAGCERIDAARVEGLTLPVYFMTEDVRPAWTNSSHQLTVQSWQAVHC